MILWYHDLLLNEVHIRILLTWWLCVTRIPVVFLPLSALTTLWFMEDCLRNDDWETRGCKFNRSMRRCFNQSPSQPWEAVGLSPNFTTVKNSRNDCLHHYLIHFDDGLWCQRHFLLLSRMLAVNPGSSYRCVNRAVVLFLGCLWWLKAPNF